MRQPMSKRRAETVVEPVRWSYPMLAKELGVSKRTLVRYVVTGQIPAPQMCGNRAFWDGDDLAKARGGRMIPGTYTYAANDREQKRRESMQRAKDLRRKGEILRKRRARAAAKKGSVRS